MNGNFYALKCINKTSVIKAGQRRHVKAEREILMEAANRFIVKLHKTFRDERYVYLLTEVLLGGELFTIMKRNGPLSIEAGRFSLACVLEAIEFLHQRRVSFFLKINLVLLYTGDRILLIGWLYQQRVIYCCAQIITWLS